MYSLKKADRSGEEESIEYIKEDLSYPKEKVVHYLERESSHRFACG